MTGGRWGVVRVAVVIPLYRQAQFLIEAVTSSLSQTLGETAIIIVNDGCPDPASHQLGTAFAVSYPDRIVYVSQRNAGLSAARNCGVCQALGRWPELEAFFFLDADNLLQSHTLETMYARLAKSERIGWVYAALERFGTEGGAWYPDTPANLYRMLFENQCDAGSLVRRKVFDDGIFFDKTEGGYEDWEFFLRLARNGYRGESAGYCGLLYRVKQQSMLTESLTKHKLLVSSIHNRHRDLLEPRWLTAVEHEHCPRFLWVWPSGQIFSAFTDPDAATKFVPPLRNDGYWPPVLIIGPSEIWQLLTKYKMLRAVLLVAQATAPLCPVSFRLEVGGQNWEITYDEQRRPPHLLCFYSGHFQAPAALATTFELSAANSVLFRGGLQLVVRIPEPSSMAPVEPLTAETVRTALSGACASGVFDPPLPAAPNENRQGPTRYFAWNRHCVKLDTTHPLIGTDKLRIGFAVPWLKLGGVDQCVIQLARAVRRLVPEATLHLVTTREGVECGFANVKAFEEIIFLSSLDWEKKTRLCDVVFRSMDLVIDAHSEAAYQSLSWRLERPKEDRTGVHLSYLHVIDEYKGRLVGYPVMAAELAHGFDGFAVISDNLRNFLINEGVSASRIRVARNAPVVRPASLPLALDMAAAKARRLASGERPLRLLFAGRADYQKGISRLKRMADLLVARGAPFQLRFVGNPHLHAEPVEWPAAHVFTHPATYDEARLASYYAEADVCVLLSRWEGVPLSSLDAMAHGCVVVATDVGGVSELVADRLNGFLIPNGRDEDVPAQAADLIGEMLQDETGSAAMRQEAVATAWRQSWDETAKVFLSFLPEAVKARHGLAGI